MRGVFVALLLLALASLAPTAAAQEAPVWLPGDAWTWAREGSLGGEWQATIQAGSRGTLRSVEVERIPVAGTADATEARLVRTWAGALKLAAEERVELRCVDLLLERQCGNSTQRWAYTPPLELVKAPLKADATWSQSVSLDYFSHDELTTLMTNETRSEQRHFRVRSVGNVTTPSGSLAGFDIVMDTEAQDSDGTAEAWVYAPVVQHFALRVSYQNGQESARWALASAKLEPRPSPGGGGGGGGLSQGLAQGGSGSTSGDTGHPSDPTGPAGPSYGPGANETQDPGRSPGSTSPAAPPAPGGTSAPARDATGPIGPPKPAERALRTPAAPMALLLLLLPLAGRALRRP